MSDLQKGLQNKLLDSGVTQTDLARHLGVSKATVSYWLAGKRKPSPDHLSDIANFFGCPVSEILGEKMPGLEDLDPELSELLTRVVRTHDRSLRRRRRDQNALRGYIESVLDLFEREDEA